MFSDADICGFHLSESCDSSLVLRFVELCLFRVMEIAVVVVCLIERVIDESHVVPDIFGIFPPDIDQVSGLLEDSDGGRDSI